MVPGPVRARARHGPRRHRAAPRPQGAGPPGGQVGDVAGYRAADGAGGGGEFEELDAGVPPLPVAAQCLGGRAMAGSRGPVRTRRVHTDLLVAVRGEGGPAPRLVLRDALGGRVVLDPAVLTGNPVLWHRLDQGVRRSSERGVLHCAAAPLRTLADRIDGGGARAVFRGVRAAVRGVFEASGLRCGAASRPVHDPGPGPASVREPGPGPAGDLARAPQATPAPNRCANPGRPLRGPKEPRGGRPVRRAPALLRPPGRALPHSPSARRLMAESRLSQAAATRSIHRAVTPSRSGMTR